MTADKAPLPVELAVFSFLDRYFDAWESGEIDDPNGGSSASQLTDFLYTFFQQFFKSVWHVELTGLGKQMKLEAARLRLKEAKGKREARRLIAAFEELCDLWADLSGLQYEASRGDLEGFNTDYLPKLLGRVSSWATAEGHDSIALRAKQALFRLEGLSA